MNNQTSLPTNKTPAYFKNLDALRFFSFLSVFISHTIFLPHANNIIIDTLINIVTFSYLGVPFFFSLSSFLISYRLLREKEKYGKLMLFNFYKNRSLRIWPAYILIVFICYIILPFAANLFHAKGPTLPSILPFIFFYVNFYIIENGSYFTFALVILWSISIEEQFYFLWGIILKFISNGLIDKIIILLFIVSIAFSYWYLQAHPKSAQFLAIHSLYTLQYFCTGALAALFYLKKGRCVLSFKLKRLTFSLVYFILIFSFLIKSDFVINGIVKSVCYGVILYDQSFNEHSIFNIGKFKLINYLGKISYGLYLYHALVMVLLGTQFHFFSNNNSLTLGLNLVQSLITLLITFIISHLSYQYVESKFLALKSS